MGERPYAPLREGRLVYIARGEMVEKELDAMIERRSRQIDPTRKASSGKRA